MKTNLSRLLALLLALAMVLPMALPAQPVRAEEVTEPALEAELPTETVPVESAPEEGENTPVFAQLNFSDDTDLASFDLYQSGTGKFVVSDGVLMPDGTDGEQKAIFNKDVSKIESVSVNIIPGASGDIYAGVYVGAKDPANEQDSINAMAFLIKSDYTGWSDAPNRIDIIQGTFDGGWKHIKTVISETGNGNNLFSGGTKQPLNLKLTFSEDVILLKLSLASNPDKYVQIMYEVEPEVLQGSVGLRTIGLDTCFDKFIVNENYVPATLTEGLKLDGTGLDSYAKTVGNMTQKPVTIEAWVWVPKLAGGSRRQAIITNYTEPTVAKNPVGTWGLYTNEYTTLYYTERTSSGTFNHTLGVPVCNNSWNHVAIVRAQGAMHVYWNGEFVQTIEHAGMGDTTVVEKPMTIGYCSVGAGTEGINSLKGQVGDIRLWSTERTMAQIQADMYREMTGTEEGLIQHWNFDSQEKGIVSNTVEGGLDVELLGHTQIGNEEIRRWDFSQESQLEDFTFYYAPTYTSETYNYAFNIKDEKLFISGSINNSSTDVKAVLKEKIDNITYMGADVTQGGTSTANVSMLFGIKSINSANVNDYEGFQVPMTRQRTSAAKRPYSEVWFNKISNGTATAVTGTSTNTTFFPGADVKLPFHIQLTFEGNRADAFMYRLDDPTVTNSQTYTAADGELDGQIGLQLKRTSVYFDNYTVVSEIPQEEEPEEKEEITFANQGYNFYTESRPWKLTRELTSAPYTLEAWVKVPVGVDDTTVAYIVGNASRAPSVSMQMIADGKLQLSYAVENTDLTVTTKTFTVDTDLRTGKWTHVAYTVDVAADTVVAYINGTAAETWTDAGLEAITIPDKIIPGNTFAIGSLEDSDDPANKFIGWIADVRMWNKALSAAELQESMMTQYTTSRDGLLFNAPLSAKTEEAFADLSGNGNTVEAYDSMLLLQTETHEPGSYSMVVIPDQQVLTHYSPDRLNALYQWIADNRETENIQIVMNVGDMADNCGNLDQWANNRAAWELLPDDLPFIVAPGNHDYDTNSGWNKGYGVREQLTLMNEYFPRSIFENYPTEVGFFDEVNSANQWQAFTVNGNSYLVFALEYVPQDDVIAWANQVVKAHPNHQVIMVTHSYVGSYGNLDVPKLWNDFLSKHENVIMAFSGHVWHTNVVRRTDQGVNGNQVHQMLMDAQVSDTGSEGNKYAAMIGILRFNADGTQCDVSYYSTDRDMYDTGSNFTLTLPKQEHKYYAMVGEESFTSVAAAIEAAGSGIVKILQSTDEAITVNTDVVIDLAGNTLSNVTVAEGYSLKLIDTAETAGSAKVAGSVETLVQAEGKSYLVTGAEQVYTARPYAVEIFQQVSLRDDLAMNLYVKADKANTVYVTFDEKTVAYDLSTMTPNENGQYILSVDVAAAQMTEQIQLRFVCGEVTTLEKSYSVRNYAEYILQGEYPETTQNMVKWMLQYGAKAQQYFGVKTDDLANAGYELEEVALPTEYKEKSVSGTISGLQYYGASLVFRNKIAVRFYFTGSVDGVSFGDWEPVAKDGMYYVEVADINPQDYSSLITLAAT
ncbi:MAG: metallophosphoesterase, partial [Oscillospiraceae bacterium]|nr:metallophosphoesterase [Oscillospiraceae bacterium]